MKKFSFIYKPLLFGLVPALLLFGNLFTTQVARAAVSPCSTTLTHQGLITADETWCAGVDPHVLLDDVTVQSGVTLTIEPGVTLVSGYDDFWKYLIIQGHLDVLGTADQPVVMKRYPVPVFGPWGGIYFDGSAGDGSGEINYAIIEETGANICSSCGGYTQTAVLVKDLPAGKQVNLSHSTIRNNVSKGLFVVNSTVNVTDTTFSQNIYPILIEGAASVVTYSGNTFSDNAYPYYDNASYTIQEDSIFINQDALTGQNFTLPAQTGLEAYVLWGNTTIPAGVTMNVEPGVTLRKEALNYLTVKGRLEVIGTQALPVLFTGIPSSNPAVMLTWGGIYFEGSAGDGSADINYATIEKAGSNFSPPDYCWNCGPSQFAVLVKDLPAGKQVNLNNSILRDNPIKGLYVINSTVNVTNTTFSHNMYLILIEGAASVVTYSGNTFSDNAYPYYDNLSYTIPEDAIFINPDALTGQNFTLPAQTGLDAYVLWGNTTIPAGVTMNVEPGVTLRKEASHFLTVQGHLEAIGTQALPIRFTGMPGADPAVIHNWGGLYFDGTAGDGSANLTYATIEVGGNGYPPPSCVGSTCWSQNAVFVKDLPTNKQVNLSHSSIEKSNARGVYVVNSLVNLTDTTFSENLYPIWIEGAASVVSYSGNNFVDNTFGYPNVYYPMPLNAIVINPDALMDHNFSLPAQTGLDAYVFWDGTTIPAGRTMTVEPGVTLRTAGDRHIIVQGHLEATGTPALPIRFSGIPNYYGPAIIDTWGGLIFDGPSGSSGHLDHAIVERGCGWWNSNCVTLMIYKLAADKSVVVEHSIVQNSANVDLAVIDSPTAQVDNNLIKGGNIGVYLATNMTVNNLAVTDQALDGVYVETGYSVDARHLTIARTGRNGFYVNTGGTGLLKNSILSQNTLAVKAEDSGQATLDTNLADANTTFSSGAVTELNTINGSATFEADGYHIQTTSDAVGIGLTGLSIVDMDGDARPMPAGSLPDLGADEVTDVTAPVVASITRANPNPTSSASVDFTVTFSEAVTGVGVGDFTLATGVSGASVIGVSGTGDTYTVGVSTGTGRGTLRLDIPDSATITDRVGNALGGLPFTGGESYTITGSPVSDFDGDGKTDLSVYKVEPWGGMWYLKDQSAHAYGNSASIPVPCDYNGDGTTDVAVYNAGTWYVKDQFVDNWGDASSIPVPGDYDGDGACELAVYKVEPWGGMWYLQGMSAHAYGNSSSIPVPADYNGDGVMDIAVYDAGTWYVKDQFVDNWGDASSIPVPGDYNGDGTDDLAVYKVEPWGGMWYIKDQSAHAYGNSESIPVPGDYNGDGMMDVAVYNAGTWYVKDQFVDNWGDATSFPLPVRDTNGDGDPYQ